MEGNKNVYSCLKGKNDELLANASTLYMHSNDHVLDVTYGKGGFWKKIDLIGIRLVTNDLKATADHNYDCRALGFADATFDHTILDLPYMHDGATVMVRKQYNNDVTTGKMNHEGIIRLYEAGMRECVRVTKPDGFIWVKIQDEIESGQQCWSHQQIELIAVKLGLTMKEMFILCNGSPHIQHHPQHHARRNHSYLMIFKKTNRSNRAEKFTEQLILEAAAEIQRRAGTITAQ